HRTPLWRTLPRLFRREDVRAGYEALARVGIAEFAAQRASTLSGGQQQRAAIARALVQGARVVLADEPIASLDPESARRVMEILAAINREDGCTVLVSLHQVHVALRYCARVVALAAGHLVRCLVREEKGPAAAVGEPTLLAPRAEPQAAASAPLLEVRDLKVHFPIRRGVLRRTVGWVRAVDGISLEIRAGRTLALVGESGCGKTTTARCILRALEPTAGAIRFRTEGGRSVDVAALPRAELRPLRRRMQMIFQDPFGSLNPRMTIADIIGEPLLVNGMRDVRARRRRVAELLDMVQLPTAY
ncbi:MAG: ATP-binding cassette domain-containing protein, partial [Geminicoccaceae bacterium]|nr:ATP-binding cassette domain-containing protein [Geminicoccaceae bacterium]